MHRERVYVGGGRGGGQQQPCSSECLNTPVMAAAETPRPVLAKLATHEEEEEALIHSGIGSGADPPPKPIEVEHDVISLSLAPLLTEAGDGLPSLRRPLAPGVPRPSWLIIVSITHPPFLPPPSAPHPFPSYLTPHSSARSGVWGPLLFPRVRVHRRDVTRVP